MSFGIANTPGAWFVTLKNQLKEMVARIGSVEKTLSGSEKIPGTSAPTAQVAAKVGQIYINVTTGEEWKCTAVNGSSTTWEKLTKTGVALTATDIGAVPVTRKVNNKALSTDISLTASDVGARPSTWTPTAADVGAVPTTRKVNSKALSADISLTASDVGARSSTWTPTAADVGAVPTTRKVNSKALSADISLTAADVGAKASSWKPFHAGTSAPSDKTQLWIDTTASDPKLKYHNGSAWVAVPVGFFVP